MSPAARCHTHVFWALSCLLAVSGRAEAQFVFGRLLPPTPEIEANAPSRDVDVSSNGTVLTYSSTATNWVPGTPAGNSKVYAADLIGDTFENLSRTGAGVALNGNSLGPVASGDGRFVAFVTQANNLDVGVATSGPHIVRKDRLTGALALVSASAAGVPASGSAGGQAREASISADGRYVAFRSDANNLVAGDGNGADDVLVKDMQTGAIDAVSRDLNGAFVAAGTIGSSVHSISADGRFVLFQSSAGNLVAGVGSGAIHVYLRDRTLGTTELVSRTSGGEAANSQSDVSALSPSARFVSFRSYASNLGPGGVSGVYVRDRVAGTTSAVPLPSVNGVVATGCRESDVSDAGTVILACFFPIPIKQQIFLHAPGAAGSPFLVSSDANDVPGDNDSAPSLAIDASGLSMAFESLSANLAPSDGNGAADVFVLIDSALLNTLFADGFED